MSFDVVFDNFIGLLADALPWFLGGAILGAALEAFLPTAWATALARLAPRINPPRHVCWRRSLPGCSMTTMPLAAALKACGARLGTLTAFIMISPILESRDHHPHRRAPRRQIHHCRDRFPVVVTVLMGLALNALQARRIRKFPTAAR